ncbi:hypothetical protein [Sporosarcina sp. FA9]|uniref:hypothetical protein n=1 Tax=Sporosarcina sp. FA9 TaxID=3413030 RepID=UPI003F656C90
MFNVDAIEKRVLENFGYEGNYHGFPIKIEYVDNVNTRKKELRPFDIIMNGRESSGSMVLPDPPDGNCYVLVNSSLKKDYWFVETLIHELIHVKDYLEFSHLYCSGDYLKMEKHDLFAPMFYFSEYHAKREGYIYLYQLLDQLNVNLDESHRFDSEVNEYYNCLVNSLSFAIQNTNSSVRRSIMIAYNLVHVLGVLSAWEFIFGGDYIARDNIPDVLKENNISIFELQNKLHLSESFDDVKNELLELKESLNKPLLKFGVEV